MPSAFEVVSVKLSSPGEQGGGIHIQGHQFSATNVSVSNITRVSSLGHRTDGLPDIFGAFQQQLGLRLDATKTSINVLVVDHMEKPSDN
jgi:hypothetical protein